jgi:hypothetical protein
MRRECVRRCEVESVGEEEREKEGGERKRGRERGKKENMEKEKGGRRNREEEEREKREEREGSIEDRIWTKVNSDPSELMVWKPAFNTAGTEWK